MPGILTGILALRKQAQEKEQRKKEEAIRAINDRIELAKKSDEIAKQVIERMEKEITRLDNEIKERDTKIEALERRLDELRGEKKQWGEWQVEREAYRIEQEKLQKTLRVETDLRKILERKVKEQATQINKLVERVKELEKRDTGPLKK